MVFKKFTTNIRGEAQIALWLPLKTVKKIYAEYGKIADKAKKEGDYVPKFKEFFIKNYITPNQKKK